MAALKALATLAVLCAATPVWADPIDPWLPFITEASQRFDVPETWIARVLRAESGGRTTLGGAPIRSRAGAIGLMQIMPRTWIALRGSLRLGPDPDDPRDNILAGAAYLRLMYDRFGYPGLFAAYNAGPARYAAYLASGTPLPAETRGYVAKVAGAVVSPPRNRSVGSDRGDGARALPVRPKINSLFAIGGTTAPDRSLPRPTLFVALHG
ncbi:soluble lytic murein transglycosylase-like protein [Sphingomonas sp. UYEF23]